MQQPMSQQEQLCQQAMQQQMMLCPVRFVYETQILVPPGDQIQPNQTFIINPQNPPPWVQNRQIQNQVVYVQQLPNNIIPSTQQHMDQNQLYLHQNFANYIQQPMLAQNQEIRSVNMVPNMVQNERNMTQSLPNTNPIQTNPQMIQNQVNLNRQVPTQANQIMETQRQYIRPQMAQQTTTRPIMAMNQIQNMPMQQTFTSMPNVLHQLNYGQTFATNAGQPRPVTQSVPRHMPNNVPNTVNVQPVAKVRDPTPLDANKMINNNLGHGVPIVNINSQVANARNFIPNYAYRPIQPRPQVRHNSTQIQIKPIQNQPIYTAKNIPNNIPNNIYMGRTENIVNRKRKSESPDEIQKKMAVAKPNYVPVTQSITVTKLCNEIGVNTSPVHRMSNSTTSISTMLQINPNSTQIVKIVDSVKKLDEDPAKAAETAKSVSAAEKDKLIRNTVFTQARGRVLQDKSAITNDMTSQTTEVDLKPENTTPVEVKMTENETQTIEKSENKATITVTTVNNPVIIKREVTIKPEISNNDNNVVKEEEDVNNDKDGVNDEKLDDKDKILFKQNRDSILTHVLDGYVIQESSFAFPIRKPLKERTLITNTRDGETNDAKEEKPPIDLPLLPFHYLQLSNERLQETNEKNDETDNKGNPFSRLLNTTVKTWTVDELSRHLLKFNWKETVSLFQDHEIDGESLFLVSKSQLLTIGVNENHADVICEFVKS